MVEALRLTKALGRTVIVFTSDNGALEGTRVTGGMHAIEKLRSKQERVGR
jgi:arylsulfatase A-like enzyme